MSEIKKPGRDISDLKARLGLKKPQPPANVRAPGGFPQPGAVPPPAGRGGYVPAPPGAGRPNVPDARVDPFGAMNAMAAPAAAYPMAQPVAIPGTVDDGTPVEKVQGKTGARLAKLGGLLLAPLFIGYLLGGVMRSNSDWNHGIDDAKAMSTEFKKLGKELQNLVDVLLVAKERGKDQKAFKMGDKALTQQLADLKLKKPGTAILFESNLYQDKELVEDLLTFYSNLATLYDRVNTHVRLSQADETLIGKDNPIIDKLGGSQFGAILVKSKNEPSSVQIVEMGLPVCTIKDKAGSPQGCGPAAPVGFEYRSDPTQVVWSKKLWSPTPSEVGTENVFFIKPNMMLAIIQKSTQPFYAEFGYAQRMALIMETSAALLESRKNLENRLNAKGEEPKQFAL